MYPPSNSHSPSDSPHASATLRLLVVSRQPSSLGPLWSAAEACGWALEVANSGCEALERVQNSSASDLVLLDLASGESDGLYTLRWLRRMRPDLPVVLLAQRENLQEKQEASLLGAQDYLLKPLDEGGLRALVEHNASRHPEPSGPIDGRNGQSHHQAEHDTVNPAVSSQNGNGSRAASRESVESLREGMFFVTAGPASQKLREQAELLAQVDVPLLIVGEGGCGKETTARLIHKLSARGGGAFHRIPCAALGDDLLERELLGYEVGAFPGAVRSKPGRLEQAQGGTILLDDIAETPLSLQAKLLHLLQEREFFRLAGESAVTADVRVMAATSANLEQALASKRLREDLYYRLSALTVHVPPLRHRRAEIPRLLEHFMQQLALHYGLPPRPLSPEFVAVCQEYSWPGNLRELESLVKRYLVMGDAELLLSELRRSRAPRAPSNGAHPAASLIAGAAAADAAAASPDAEASISQEEDPRSGLRSLVDNVKGEAEKNAIARALERTRWNRKAAARLLQVSYRTLLYKIQQYRMVPPGILSSGTSASVASSEVELRNLRGSDAVPPANSVIRLDDPLNSG